MLTDFFQPNHPLTTFDAAALQSHFETSNDIRNAYFEPPIWPLGVLRKKHFTNVSLAKTIFRRTTFTECSFEDCLFIGSTFDNVEFHRCRFINCNFYKSTFEGVYLDPATIYLDRSYRKTAANVGLALYRALYEDASKMRQSDYAIKADIEFRRWKRWQLGYDAKSKKISFLQRVTQHAFSLTYEWIAGFGYKPSQFIFATICLFTTVSIINSWALSGALLQDGKIVKILTLPDGIYFTYSMLTALGFSTITPTTSFAKMVAVFEALFGIGWLGIFTSLLVKKFIK